MERSGTPIPMKYALGIECSNPSTRGGSRGEVALAKITSDGLGFVDSLELSEDARGSDGLMGAVDTLCLKHEITPADLARIVVSVGPGGYTALRVSVTVAKVLATVVGCGVVAVPSAAVAGVGLLGCDAVVALASKNGKAHCTRVVDGQRTELGVIGADELVGVGAKVLVGDGFVPKELVEAASKSGMEFRTIELAGRACLEASVGMEEVAPEALGVLYAREPDAVTQWRALHG